MRRRWGGGDKSLSLDFDAVKLVMATSEMAAKKIITSLTLHGTDRSDFTSEVFHRLVPTNGGTCPTGL